MINAQIKCIVPVFVSAKNQYEVLSTDRYQTVLPTIDVIPFMDLQQACGHILSNHVKSNVSISHIPIKITDIDITDIINIYVMLFINFDATIYDSYLRPIDINNDKYPINAQQTLSLLIR